MSSLDASRGQSGPRRRARARLRRLATTPRRPSSAGRVRRFYDVDAERRRCGRRWRDGYDSAPCRDRRLRQRRRTRREPRGEAEAAVAAGVDSDLGVQHTHTRTRRLRLQESDAARTTATGTRRASTPPPGGGQGRRENCDQQPTRAPRTATRARRQRPRRALRARGGPRRPTRRADPTPSRRGARRPACDGCGHHGAAESRLVAGHHPRS